MSSSSRLTKFIREEIAALALRDAFEKELTTILKERLKLIDTIYNSLYTAAERKGLNAAPKDCIYTEAQMEFRTPLGHHHYWSFAGYLPYSEALRDQAGIILSTLIEPDKDFDRPVSRGNPKRLLEDRSVLAEVDNHHDKLKDLTEKYTRARANLMAVLESVHTFKKLNVVWPEGLKYYSNFDTDNTKPGLPAVMVDELNKALGLK